MPKISVCLTTISNRKDAERIAKKLVKERLAACVNILPSVVSHYRWRGRQCRDSELLLVIKTRTSKIKALQKTLLLIHPYDVPEFIHWEIDGGSRSYLDWVMDSTARS